MTPCEAQNSLLPLRGSFGFSCIPRALRPGLSSSAPPGLNRGFTSGGAALSAPLDFVQKVAVDAAGNVFVADPGNHIVVKTLKSEA